MFYTYKDNVYFKQEDVLIKTEKGWVEGVEYFNLNQTYVRTKEDFESKFIQTKIPEKEQDVQAFIRFGSRFFRDCRLKENVGDEKYARFVLSMRNVPASVSIDLEDYFNQYKLYCEYEGVKHIVIGFSRFGDVWLNEDLNATSYSKRVNISDCYNFSKD